MTDALTDEPKRDARAPFAFVAMSDELARIRANLRRMSRERNAVMRDLARVRAGRQGRREAPPTGDA